MNINESFRKGDKVRFKGEKRHALCPDYYPAVGVEGVYLGGGWVQWPKGTTSGDGKWDAPDCDLEAANANETKRACQEADANKHNTTLSTPHLNMHGEDVGIIGMPTNYRDILGRALFVGDVVEIFNCTNVSYGDNAICSVGENAYVMGIKTSCNSDSGATGYWKLFKKRGYAEVKNGECVDGVRYVKET